MTNDLEVLIVGGGHAGTSTAYQLVKQGADPDKILLVEAGKIGRGSDDMISGTLGPNVPAHTKMITTLLETGYEEFAEMHGESRTKTFLELTDAGCKMQKETARALNPNLVRELGSLIVGHGVQLQWLQEDKKAYEKLGFNKFEYRSRQEIAGLFNTKQTAFDGGLFAKGDAIIDSVGYACALVKNSGVQIADKTLVKGVKETPGGVLVETDKAGTIATDKVVLATNGFYNDKNLEGLLEKNWSFIVCYENCGPNTPNTWDKTENYHYWTRQDNVLMIGGEDKPVRNGNTRYSTDEQKAMRKLIAWANEKFPQTKGKTPIATHFGIFAYTPDLMPIVGKFSKNSRVFYIVGCNGYCQAQLTLAASLMPGLLGYRELSDREKSYAQLLSPNRRSLKR